MADLTVDAVDVPALPFDGVCPVCHATVLVVEVQGMDVVAELPEIVERFACPLCAQVEAKGHSRAWCHRCGGSRFVGEPLPPFGVAVNADGAGRYFTGRRSEGEAVHAVHVCDVGPR